MMAETEVRSARVAEGSMILLLSSWPDPRDDSACMDLMTFTDPSDLSVMHITFTRSADDHCDMWQSHIGEISPERMVIISAEDQPGTRAPGPGWSPSNGEEPTVVPLEHPGDLTQLGVTTTDHLFDWKEDETQVVVCVHSLTALLQFVDLKKVYQFLHIFKNHVDSVGAVAHCHLDPMAHDATTVATLKSLFDSVIELDSGNKS